MAYLRFRRGQKKDKQKQMSTAIENMAVEDPQAVVDLMEETDKRRILVRCFAGYTFSMIVC